MWVLAFVLLVLPGFGQDARLSEVASYAAGKPAAVYCAADAQSWRNVGRPSASGFAYLNGDVYLDPNVCALVKRQKGEPTFQWADALLTLVHEAQHAAGISNESEAECAALRKFAAVAIVFYGFKSRSDRLRLLVRQAWRAHDSLPLPYQDLC